MFFCPDLSRLAKCTQNSKESRVYPPACTCREGKLCCQLLSDCVPDSSPPLGSVQSPVAQSCPTLRLFATPWTATHQVSLSITSSRSLLKLMSIGLVMPSNHFILCRPLLLLPSVFPSIRVFSNESALPHQLAKVLEFQLQHQSFQ